MKIYIRSEEIISPQPTFSSLNYKIPAEYFSESLQCIEPDYKEFIDSKVIRRMSRIIKMGTTTAIECLKKVNLEKPDGIITATSFGCLSDTFVFLKKMVENHEEMLSPAAFIQSTHNTIGAQIALILQCHNYNNTFSQRGFSFENALVDALLLLKEKEAVNILVGAVDEVTEISHDILKRFGLFRKTGKSNFELFNYEKKGTINGEGSAFFLVSNQKENAEVELRDVQTLFKPNNNQQIVDFIESFIRKNKLSIDEIDLVINGRNGDRSNDVIYEDLQSCIFSNNYIVNYKHLSGEYPTSISFATWLGVKAIENSEVPFHIHDPMNIKNVLIYNTYLNTYHSLLLLSAC
jgi:hypothetical protein